MGLKCKIGFHSWNGCKCTACGKVQDKFHNWKGCLCTICGKVRDQEHNWHKDCDKCARCGKERVNQHDWSKDCEKCSKCGKTRNDQHEWNNCICAKCSVDRHTWNGFKCSNCNQYKSKLATASLIELSIKGDIQKVKEAIEAKADLNTKDSHGFTAYLQAASMGHIEIVKLFIEAGISVNQKYVGNNNKTITLLHVASYCGRSEMVEYLLSIGAEVDIKDEFNDTPLFNAVVNKKTEVVKVLLRNGAYPHSQCRKNFTPYQYAVEAKLHDIISIFEEHFSTNQAQITDHSRKGEHPKLNPYYCPLCGRMMIENSHNLEILSAMGFSECNSCGISYASLTGHQTSNMTAIEKCREMGYKVSIQPGGYGVYSIKD